MMTQKKPLKVASLLFFARICILTLALLLPSALHCQNEPSGRYQCYILSHILSKSNTLKAIHNRSKALYNYGDTDGALYEQPLILSDINDFPFNIYFTLPRQALDQESQKVSAGQNFDLSQAFFAFMNTNRPFAPSKKEPSRSTLTQSTFINSTNSISSSFSNFNNYSFSNSNFSKSNLNNFTPDSSVFSNSTPNISNFSNSALNNSSPARLSNNFKPKSARAHSNFTSSTSPRPNPSSSKFNRSLDDLLSKSPLFATLAARTRTHLASKSPPSGNPFFIEEEPVLILAFRIEEVVNSIYDPFNEDTLSLDKNKDAFLSLLIEDLAKSEKHCRTLFLFTYGDESRLISPASVGGTDTYLDNLIDKDNKFALCISLKTSGENSITNGGAFTVAPSHLLRLVTDAFYDAGAPYSIKGGFISTLYRFNLLQTSARTNKFLSVNIPTCGIEFNTTSTSSKTISKVISTAAKNFGATDKTTDKSATAIIDSSDKRSLGVKLGQKTFWISEKVSVILFLIFTGLSILLLIEFTLSLRSENSSAVHKQMIRDIVHLLYLIPLTVLVTLISLSLGQALSAALNSVFALNTFSRIAAKVFTVFFILSLYFIVILRAQGPLISSAYSYFILLIALFNIFLFTSIDISLFYLFVAEYIIVFFSRFAQKTLKICLFFVAMCVPLVPYAIQFIKYVKPSAWEVFINSSLSLNILSSFLILPYALVWLRILVRLNSKWKVRKMEALSILRRNTLSVAGFSLILTGVLIAVVRFIPLQYKSTSDTSRIFIKKREGMVKLSVSDHKYFEETSRVLNIDCLTESERLIVSIKGNIAIPIAYSDYPFVTFPATKTCVFSLPPNCPKKLTLHYIAQSLTPATIRVSATFSEGNDEYSQSTATLFTMN